MLPLHVSADPRESMSPWDSVLLTFRPRTVVLSGNSSRRMVNFVTVAFNLATRLITALMEVVLLMDVAFGIMPPSIMLEVELIANNADSDRRGIQTLTLMPMGHQPPTTDQVLLLSTPLLLYRNNLILQRHLLVPLLN